MIGLRNEAYRTRIQTFAVALVVAFFSMADVDSPRVPLDAGFNAREELQLGMALDAAWTRAQQCFAGVSLPGGGIAFEISLDGDKGTMSVSKIDSPLDLDPRADACLRAAYALTVPHFDGAPRTTTFMFAPSGATIPAGPTPEIFIKSPLPANYHICHLDYRGRMRDADITVAFVVDADGGVSNVRPAVSSGDSDLDAAATACVSQWRYVPMRAADDSPITRELTAIIHWRTM
ncbi:MAG TPA: TonB family protein [Rhizomicrobium sp.]|nr:TonB family protein [Rhizomicrobium sp.]